MKKILLFGLLLFSAMMYGQTSEQYVYLSNYEVQTATGEKTRIERKYFNCKFNADKSICYETEYDGKLHKGEGYEYKYVKTVNNIRVYVVYYNNNTASKYLYFSSNYNKLNIPGGYHQVYTYDRVYPDKRGNPTQLW